MKKMIKSIIAICMVITIIFSAVTIADVGDFESYDSDSSSDSYSSSDSDSDSDWR